MIATFNDQTEAVLWLPPLMTKPRLCYMIAIPTFKEQTEAVLWLPPLMTNPRLCYDCHL